MLSVAFIWNVSVRSYIVCHDVLLKKKRVMYGGVWCAQNIARGVNKKLFVLLLSEMKYMSLCEIKYSNYSIERYLICDDLKSLKKVHH